MAVRTKEEIMNIIKENLGDDLSDENLSLIEDISDTFDDLENSSNDTEDWKTKYEENDAEWRRKYRDRFFNSENDVPDDKSEPPKSYNYEDLFK